MSEETKSTWQVNITFSNVDKDEVEKLQSFLHDNLEPDVLAQLTRMGRFMTFFHRFTQIIYLATGRVNFESPDDFGDSPKSVIRDMRARSEFILKEFNNVLQGRRVILPADYEEILGALESLLDKEAKHD